jgi:hypothetical protein
MRRSLVFFLLFSVVGWGLAQDESRIVIGLQAEPVALARLCTKWSSSLMAGFGSLFFGVTLFRAAAVSHSVLSHEFD